MQVASANGVRSAAKEPLRGSCFFAPLRRNRGKIASRLLVTTEAVGTLVLVTAMVTTVWASVWLHLAQQHCEVATRAEQYSRNLVRAAAASVSQTIAGVDDALRFMRAVYSADPKRFDLAAWTNRVNEAHPIALEFVILNRDGLLTASSLGPVSAHKDLSGQTFFKAQLDGGQDRLFISDPMFGHDSGRWSVLFTRRLATADGWMTGVMAASMDSAWLTSLHQALDIEHGSLTLIGTEDGIVRGVAVHGTDWKGPGVGESIVGTPLLPALARVTQSNLNARYPGHDARPIVAFQQMENYPLIVAVGLDSKEVFSAYALHARQYEIFASCLTAIILLMGALLLRNTYGLLASRQLLSDAVDAISQGIVMVDRRGRIPVINRRAHDLLQGSVPGTASDRRTGQMVAGDSLTSADIGQVRRCPPLCEHAKADGTVLEIRTHALQDGSVVRTYTDITERKKAEAAISYLAYHDPITGLANRRLLTDTLEQAIARMLWGSRAAVLSVDLDRFKHVNDEHGHMFGDSVLCQVADRMRELIGDSDLAARFGGDEFCIFQVTVDQPAAAELLATKLLGRLLEPYKVAGQEARLSASVGIAICPTNGSSVDELLKNADTALRYAKEAGRNRYLTYRPAMDDVTAERRLLEADLRTALERGELSLLYEPIFDTASLRPVSLEALVRWNHPVRGCVAPGVFIPIAERLGLIGAITEWVVETACSKAVHWPGSMRVAVNLSPTLMLERDVLARTMATLAKTGLPSDRFGVEITEGVLIENRDRALSTLAALRRSGVQVSLDDFGTGYSSLSYLRQFPLDNLKIDKSFVEALRDDVSSKPIVKAILTLGQSLNLTVIAEGVETDAQFRWLRAAGCPQVQGHLLARPISSDEIDEFLMRAILA